MSYKLTRENQPFLLSFVQDETNTEGWRSDAVAYAATTGPGADGRPVLVAAGVWENFTRREADFSFAMAPGRRVTHGIIDSFVLLSFHPRAFNLDRVWLQTSEHNIIAQRAILAIGASFQFRKRAGHADGSDAIVFLMERPAASPPAAKATTEESYEG